MNKWIFFFGLLDDHSKWRARIGGSGNVRLGRGLIFQTLQPNPISNSNHPKKPLKISNPKNRHSTPIQYKIESEKLVPCDIRKISG
jgi:hypothetical protein